MTTFFKSLANRPLPVLATILALTPSLWASATEISSQPLASLPNVTASPNILFVLDSSGSMNWSFMPDDLGDTGHGTTDTPNSTWYGYWSSQCNGVAYDPTHKYTPPKKYNGDDYPNASFTAAWTNGYSQTGSTNLSTRFFYNYTNTSTVTTTPTTTAGTSKRPAMDWTYTASGVITTTDFYQQCASSIPTTTTSHGHVTPVPGTAPGVSVFTQVLTISLTSAAPALDFSNLTTDAQQTNYANWYSYYSHRYLLMRTAMGQAMQSLDEGYRVGFSTIYDTTAQDGTGNFVSINGFDSTQKQNFYASLYAVAPSGGTNLPDALSEAGRYFAHKVSGQSADPMEYACQRNYTLLSTDGYWNSNLNDFQLDGATRVGNQDGAEVPPMSDGATHTTATTTTVYKAPATRNKTVAKQTRTRTWTVTSTTKNFSGNTKYTKTAFTETQTQSPVTPQVGTATYTETKVVTDGVQTSDTCSPGGGACPPASPTVTWVDSTPIVSNSTDDGGVATGTTGTTTQGNGQPANVSSWSTYSPSSPATTFSTPQIGTYTGTPKTTFASTGGSSDTLADVAEYYYKTDLRSNALGNCSSTSSGGMQDVCADIVPTASGDPEKFQHMNTFTVGLGVNGTLPNTSDTLAALTAGSLNWPVPDPNNATGGDARNVDDLWHTALNGRGQYYSALSADALTSAITGFISTVSSVKGAGSGSSTSSLTLVKGDNNQIYTASYVTNEWTGDLIAQTLNGDGTIKATVWSAQTLLDSTNATARTIYFNGGGATPALTPLTYAKLTTAGLNPYFDNLCSKTVVPSQCSGLSPDDKALANNGTNLVNYLRGVRTYENVVTAGTPTTASALYRTRAHVLGDIIDGEPVYVGKPPFSYTDAGYADFVTAQASRTPVVYTAANDGMLHAFSASTKGGGGSELWAYVPTAVLPNLYKLANANYSANHQYYVDGAPVEGDAKLGGAWKTILVGGFNDGGQGYYALDITVPESPKLLWEFTDANMGLSYGNPIITKRQDGTWVVAFASGYNNTSGDGNGHLFVLDAATGSKLLDIPTYTSGTTAAGTKTTPSGLAQINTWIDDSTDNTSLRFYGGDLLGNLWRFDIDNRVAPNQKALLLAQFTVGGVAQPITTLPETVSIKKRAAVIVATGRYLGSGDITDKTQQSLYVVADDLTATGWGNARTNTAFVQQTFSNFDATAKTATLTANNSQVDFTNPAFGGWWLDLPHSGERVFANMALFGTQLTMSTAIPSGDACTVGGASWLYDIDVSTANGVTNLWSSTSLIVGVGEIIDANGNVTDVINSSDGSVGTHDPPTGPPGGSGGAHRTSWRELTN